MSVLWAESEAWNVPCWKVYLYAKCCLKSDVLFPQTRMNLTHYSLYCDSIHNLTLSSFSIKRFPNLNGTEYTVEPSTQ